MTDSGALPVPRPAAVSSWTPQPAAEIGTAADGIEVGRQFVEVVGIEVAVSVQGHLRAGVPELHLDLPDADWGDEEILDERTTKLSRLAPGDQFLYVFDFGDGWRRSAAGWGSRRRSTGCARCATSPPRPTAR